MDLMTGLSVISKILEITKELRQIDDKIVVAEFKLRISDIVDKLLDAKAALQDAQAQELQLRAEISDLKAKAKNHAKLKDSNGLLFEIDEAGENIGEPFCNLCFAKEEKLIRMRRHDATTSDGSHFLCDNCKTQVTTGPKLPFPKLKRDSGSWMR